MSNKLRRTKEKLKILTETPNINWVLFDVIEILEEFYDGIDSTNSERLDLIEQIREKYLRYIKENKKEELKQSKLFDK